MEGDREEGKYCDWKSVEGKSECRGRGVWRNSVEGEECEG